MATEWTTRFWGDQGRVGRIGDGPNAGGYVFAYPDTREGSWTIVEVPVDGSRADEGYGRGAEGFDAVVGELGVVWLPKGPAEEEIERRYFGWRPLRGPVDWLQ